jgi:hypothetical protein
MAKTTVFLGRQAQDAISLFGALWGSGEKNARLSGFLPLRAISTFGALWSGDAKTLDMRTFFATRHFVSSERWPCYCFSGWAWRLKMAGSKGSTGVVDLGGAGWEAANSVGGVSGEW